MNSKLLFRIFIPILGLLAGVQFWILTDLIVVGVGVGLGVGGFLVWFVSGLNRKAPAKKRFIGEVSETIDEEDFVEVVETSEPIRTEGLQAKVKERPQQVANSIKTMLLKDRSSPRS